MFQYAIDCIEKMKFKRSKTAKIRTSKQTNSSTIQVVPKTSDIEKKD